MGRSYYAIVFIGYKITKDKLVKYVTTETIKKSLCKCKGNDETHNFCHQCGNQNTKKVIDTKVINYLDGYKQYNPYEDYGKKNEDTYIVLSEICNRASSYETVPTNSGLNELTVTNDIKNKLMNEVNKIERWNEHNYGLYTFVECNY